MGEPQLPREGGDASALQSQIRDLAALLAMPAMWRGRDLNYIAVNLLDSLVTLLRLDFAYLRLEDPAGGPPLELYRPHGAIDVTTLARLLEAGSENPDSAPRTIPNPLGGAAVNLYRIRHRLDRERGVVIAGSQRRNFPDDVESFLLRTAVDQGMVALQGSRLMRDLQLANQAKATFLATMSHELRTPLNAILGYIDLLDAGVSGELNEGQKLHLRRVRAGGEHLLQLIEGILMFARVDAGKERVEIKPVDLCDIVRDTAALVEPLARNKGLQFRTHLPAESCVVNTDAGKIRQIILNLLSNGLKFTDRGHVDAELRAGTGRVEIIVRDTGPGIPPEQHELIFEPFRQVGNVYTGKAAGTGLGLSVSRQLARLLGGDLSVESEVGSGSSFIVTLNTS